MASLFKRGSVWYVGFTFEGRRVEKTTGESVKSKALVRAVEIEAGYRGGEGAAGVFLSEALAQYLQDLDRRGKYRSAIGKNVGKFLDALGEDPRVGKVTTSHVRSALASLMGKGMAPGTLNLFRTHLSGLFSFCEAEGWVVRNPVRGVRQGSGRKVRPKRAFSLAEWGTFLAAVREKSARRWSAYRVMALSGLRPDEATRLTERDLTRGDRPLWHLRPDITKVRRRDVVPMLPECHEALPRAPLWPDGRLLGPVRWAGFERDLGRAGLEKRLMRHKTLKMTCDLYGELGLDDLFTEVDDIPRLGL